jgi:hypothetical protein
MRPHRWCSTHRRPWVYTPPAVVYAPPPPPVVYAAPAPVYGPPSLSFGITLPLR